MVATISSEYVVAASEAKRRILKGTAPAGMRVEDTLAFEGLRHLNRLPVGLKVRRLVLRDCPVQSLPDGLEVRHLELHGCPRLTHLPAGLSCYELLAPWSNLTALPADLRVEYRLDLRDSRQLSALPAGLQVGTLILSGCTALTSLPEGLEVCFLDLRGCIRLAQWPRRMSVGFGRLDLGGCTQIKRLPAGLRQLAQLDLRDCPSLQELPPGLEVGTWLDVAGSGVTKLPASLEGVSLRWRGVPVSEQIAFRPDTLTPDDILQEPNAELRRVMLERVGFERFFEQVEAEELDRDRDPGGVRRLLRVVVPDDEDLVCVALACPSTGRRYVLRVPPTLRTCRQAVAWMAGFNDPADYSPLIET